MHRFDYRLIRQMLILAPVADSGSFSRVSRLLAISQPPLIAQINELESRLRVRFLIRGRTGVRLTPAGEALMPEIEALISQAEALDYSARTISEKTRGVIRIGAVYEAMTDMVPRILEKAAYALPDISVFTEEIDSCEAEYKLAQNELHLAIGRFERFKNKNLKLRVLQREKPVLIVPSSDAVCAASSVRLSDLADRDWIVTGRDKSPDYGDRITGFFRAAGFSPRIRFTVDSIARQIAFVSCRLGSALVPESCARTLPAPVRAVHLSESGFELIICAAWNERCPDPSLKKFLALLPKA